MSGPMLAPDHEVSGRGQGPESLWLTRALGICPQYSFHGLFHCWKLEKATCIWTTRWWLVTSKICSKMTPFFWHFLSLLLPHYSPAKNQSFSSLSWRLGDKLLLLSIAKNSCLDLLTCIIQSSKLETQSLEISCHFCWCINNCLDLLTCIILSSKVEIIVPGEPFSTMIREGQKCVCVCVKILSIWLL